MLGLLKINYLMEHIETKVTGHIACSVQFL